MKVLIVNTFDVEGGAARAAYRLHRGLLSQNIDSYMLVQNKSTIDYAIFGPTTRWERITTKIRPHIENILLKLYKKRTQIRFSSSLLPFSEIVNKINLINPDIVHLHWICDAMLPIKDLANIKVPIVWSLHDMWVFTGGCHYSDGCELYRENCNSCKILNQDMQTKLSQVVFSQKQKTFSKIQSLTIVGLSKWLANCARHSKLLKDKKILSLPNPIDTNEFKPSNKKNAKLLWNLPLNKKLILFSAANARADSRKGFKELYQCLDRLDNNNIELVIFGNSKPKVSQNFKFPTHYIGHLVDDISMITLYNAVDIVIVPSLEENLSNVILESLSCGVPVVGFDIGGNGDMIIHKQNGYLAKPFDIKDLENGIEWTLNEKNYQKLCQYARDKILNEFESSYISQKYINLYNEILISNSKNSKIS